MSLLPSVLSLWVVRRTAKKLEEQIRQARSPGSLRQVSRSLEPDLKLELLGDLNCYFNARSPYLRCAVNPSGPCKGCHYYKSRFASNNY